MADTIPRKHDKAPQPRRLLFLISRFLDGGIDTVLLQYLKHLAKDPDYEVTLAIGCDMGQLEVFKTEIPDNVRLKYLVDNPIIRNFRIKRFKNTLPPTLKAIGEIFIVPVERAIKSWRIKKLIRTADTVIDFDACHTAFLARCSKPTLAWLHFSLEILLKQNPRRTHRILTRLDKYTHIITICDSMTGEMAHLRPDLLPKTTCLYNPIDTASIRKQANETLKTGYSYILAVERLEESQKDISTLLRAYALCDISQHLVIVGKGKDEEMLRTLAATLGIDNKTHFVGFQSNPYKWMKNADLIVHSAKFEGLGFVLVEAMSLGKMIVATDCPIGPREVLDNGRAGILTPMGDAEALAAAIKRGLSDNGLRDQMLSNAKQHCQRFTIEHVVQKLKTVLH